MRNVKLSKLWDALHSSYWFIPTVMVVAAIALAFTMLWFDRTGQSAIEQWWWIYTGGADGARSLLEAVAGSMISISATAFSITIVALQLAASNFGPRLLRNFMQDTGNQIVLGTFIGTFIYCLLVLRTIHGEGNGYSQFVPQLSVTVGIVLAILGIGVLIYFIHHASTIIQASHVIQGVSNDLDQAIKRLFPEKMGHGEPERQRQLVTEIPVSFENQACPVRANDTGYLQVVDDEELMHIARKYNLLLHIKTRPGKFVVRGNNLVMALSEERFNNVKTRRGKSLQKQINDAFILGNERTEQQDVEFPINQLVEIALRALSPAVNDPFTAIRCIDRLCSGLCNLVQRDFPSRYRYDKDNNLRVIVELITFEELVDSAFNEIRQYARSDRIVTIHLIEAIGAIATYTDNSKYHAVLQRHADTILQSALQALPDEQDRQEVQKRYNNVIKNQVLQ
jgi:uncharacterized membrane protein